MDDIVLHHYATSPFSEKVRLVLGMKQMRWRSVTVPSILPKPDVVALTGGYRRTPFMQIGADIYCDSALMCRVIDRRVPEPPLYPESTHGLAAIVAQWADQSFFWTAVPFTMQPAGVTHLFAGLPPEAVKAFGADRAAMSPAFRRAPLHDQAAAFHDYLGRLEHLLADDRPFLLGALPSIADFAAVQSIWFVRRAPPVAAHLENYRRVDVWYERVTAFGHGSPEPMTSAEAIALAHATTAFAPCGVDAEAGLAAGTMVGVTPADYAHDEVVGSLVGLDASEVVVERVDARAGTVHVHFPRIGFHVKALKKESP
ncbi:MAG: glutathione S-transferase family protein [Burkholderiales bacterium]|nr:glutathione S-transferase family protein [Burkholderiales bacterium]